MRREREGRDKGKEDKKRGEERGVKWVRYKGLGVGKRRREEKSVAFVLRHLDAP